MESEPTNSELALHIGIDEAEVERYRGDTFRLGDGSWLIHFAFVMPKELRQRFTGSFTVRVDRTVADPRRVDYL
ncbi:MULTISPECIES: hypothetical protein [Pseudomonas]|uniref:Uncharacterized protein n=1 Tax=Pseudomonas hunanensis TaxID=1247546 RepID=A0ACC6KA02_9PSED|nr:MULTISPECIES: hypothetical protein [Pseudomonas]MBP2263142.1 hypothetical protein [Pseudomonas sp. BP8]MDR6715268.1 hypothetical protein [Pseudomonas hunanensis]HDS1736299.1 hypothetical protein [Pseudomonas putida]